MKTLCLIGGGLLGKHLLDLFKKEIYIYKKIIIFDDHSKKISRTCRPFWDWELKEFCRCDFVVALGYRHLKTKKAIISKILKSKRNLISLVHETAFVAHSATINKGAIIFPSCVIDSFSRIGYGSILHHGVIVSHDSTLGQCCFLAPGVIMCGKSKIGDCTFIGAGSVIQDEAVIGELERKKMFSKILRT
jgi:acetyltransferase-like isoleucine patch superfamily enzyme